MLDDPEIIEKIAITESAEYDENSEHKKIGSALLLAAVICALACYLLLMVILGDSLSSESDSSKTGKKQEVVEIVKLGGFTFAPVSLEPLTDENQLLQETLITAEISGWKSDRDLYLRVFTAERFTNIGIVSDLGRQVSYTGPEFNFNAHPSAASTNDETGRLTFFKNFEARLPYPPVLGDLGGPMPFSPMQDGSIAFEQTIAVGDEFECRFKCPKPLSADDLIPMFPSNSPYLVVDPIDDLYVIELATKMAATATSQVEKVFQIRNFLENSSKYNNEYKSKSSMHPVVDFLNGGMQGHCQHFAGAMVLLCRLKGIPARMAGGFYTNSYSEGQFIVLQAMAHAWAEVLTTEGWKTVDVAASQHQTEKRLQKAQLKLPTKEQLKQHLQQNRQRAAAAAETSDGEARDGKNRDGETRNKAGDLQNKTEAKTPGTIVPDEDRQKKYQQEKQEHQAEVEKEKDAARKKRNKSRLTSLIGILLAILFLAKLKQRFLSILKWLIKLLSPKEKEQKEQSEATKELQQMLLQDTLQSGDLSGIDLIELFSSFAFLMGEKGQPRLEHETPAEYFERLCVTFNLRLAEGRQAARLLETELYGQKAHTAKDLEQFVATLRQLLAKIK